MKKILLSFFAIAFFAITKAQTVAIRSNPGFFSNFIVIGDNNYHVSESIFLESEIGAGNFITAGTAINHIDFSCFSLGTGSTTVTSPNFKIYLKDVPLGTSTLATGVYSTAGYTLVYSGAYSFLGTGFQGVDLTTPYTRAAGTNLEVLIERTDNVVHTGNGFDASQGNSVAGPAALTTRRYNSAIAPVSSVTSLTESSFRQQIQLRHVVCTNDEALGAITLTVGTNCSGFPFTNFGATQSYDEPFPACVGTAGYHSVWYKFVAPASGAVRISNDYSGGSMGNDTRVALYKVSNVNDYSTFSAWACDDDNGSIVGTRSVFYSPDLIPGDTYYIQVDDYDGSTTMGTFCITVDELTASMLSPATACTSGQDLTNVNCVYPGNYSLTDNNSNLIATFFAASPASGTTTFTSSLNINTGSVRSTGYYYLDRNFQITSNKQIYIQFYFLKSELDALIAKDPSITLNNLASNSQLETVSGCHPNFVLANGTSYNLAQTGFNGTSTDGLVKWIEINSGAVDYNFYLGKLGAPLPISLLNLSGYKNGNSNQLKWTTSTEQNNRGFEVQRSSDGINYRSIGFVNSQANGGNSLTQLNYSYIDNNITDIRQYYRLRQVDIDGNSKLSNILLIKGSMPITLVIDGMFPNPASSFVNVIVAAPKADNATVVVTDVAGRIMLQKKVNVETGSNTIPIDINKLSYGTYIVKIVYNSNNESAVSRFVKQ